ncbi:MAG: hypothetical protein A3H43_02655 [Gammaproteobacteria bacterium RIFCSPLOWO2_02_FULL_42_9]|nr:MAG: hypothetical protein A3H43_02655 [Gammaproteobacteria bacterium RIFCSPLOWO2_02_FULL_42_9]
MRFTTKTEYGMVCLIYMARRFSPNTPQVVTIREIAEIERLPEPYVAKILNKLRFAGIVSSYHGKQGGYTLARDPARITLKEVIEALEGSTFDVFCEPGVRDDIVCTHFRLCGVKLIWNRTKEILDQFYSTVTVEMMVRGQEPLKKDLVGTRGK